MLCEPPVECRVYLRSRGTSGRRYVEFWYETQHGHESGSGSPLPLNEVGGGLPRATHWNLASTSQSCRNAR
jgi:hypothetical protein